MKQQFRGSNRGLLVAIIIIAAFLFVTSIGVYSYFLVSEGPLHSTSFLVRYHLAIMVGMATFGVVAGASVFYFMSRKVEAEHHSARSNAEVVLRFLSQEERLVVNALLESKGKMLQSELSRQPGMNRVKAHRTLSRLASRDIVELGEYGKTRVVKLKQEIYESLRQ